jgi:hypothetical protein
MGVIIHLLVRASRLASLGGATPRDTPVKPGNGK